MKSNKFDIEATSLWGPIKDLEIYRALLDRYLMDESDMEHKATMLTKLLVRIMADHPELNAGNADKELLVFCRTIDKERRILRLYNELEAMNLDDNTPSKLIVPFESPQALKYWNRLQKAGFVGANYQLANDVSRRQAMYIADLFSETMGVKAKWKPFEQLWNMKNLAQEKHQMQESGTLPPRHKEIEQCFSN